MINYLWFIAVFCAFFVKGVCGFANTLIFSSIMSFGTNNINISPVDLLIGIPSNVIMVWKNRAKARASIFLPLAVLVVLGVIPGALFLKNADVTSVKIIFGAVIIVVGLQMLIQERFLKPKEGSKPNPVVVVVLGLLSGIMCGLFGIGAILAAYVSKVSDDVPTFKANMCIVFLVDNVIRFVLYTMWGILTLESYKTAGLLLPVMVIGLLTGMLLSKKLKECTVKNVVIVMLIISGISLIINSIIK